MISHQLLRRILSEFERRSNLIFCFTGFLIRHLKKCISCSPVECYDFKCTEHVTVYGLETDLQQRGNHSVARLVSNRIYCIGNS